MSVDYIQKLNQLAKNDVQYWKMREEFVSLETRLGNYTKYFSNEVQDCLWAALCMSEAMNQRMIQILCDRFNLWDAFDEL